MKNSTLIGSKPQISVIIPTRNSERTLKCCLESLFSQKYPKDKIEVIIVDAYSRDSTVNIARAYGCKVFLNRLITAEAGKALGADVATGELLLFIDSDNILVDDLWLVKMVNPLVCEPDLVASEALLYGYFKSLGKINRVCALIGSDDPFSVYLGFYGRFSHLKGRWTDIPLRYQDRGSYIVVHLYGGRLPTMGANGFLIRADILKRLSYRPYFFDVDLVHEMVKLGYTKVARVRVAVIHLFAGSYTQYIQKTYRRIRDYYIFSKRGLRKYNWFSFDWIRFLKLVLGILFPPLIVKDSIRAYRKKPDRAWFLLYPLSFLTALIYSIKELSSGFYLLRQRFRNSA